MPAPTKLVEVAEKAARAVDDVDAGGERLDPCRSPVPATRSVGKRADGNPAPWRVG